MMHRGSVLQARGSGGGSGRWGHLFQRREAYSQAPDQDRASEGVRFERAVIDFHNLRWAKGLHPLAKRSRINP